MPSGRKANSIPSRRIRPVDKLTRKGPTSTSSTGNRIMLPSLTTFWLLDTGSADYTVPSNKQTHHDRGFRVKSRNCGYSTFLRAMFLVLSVSPVWAQTGSTSGITGRVTDTTGAVLPGVSVTATSIATNQSRMVLTLEDGVYRIPLLDPGAYRLRFGAAGFKTKDVMSVTLAVTETFALDQT